MDENEKLIASLCAAIEEYKLALSGKAGEEKDDLLRVAGQAEAIADSMKLGETARVKLSIYAFSRQVTDSFYPQPPEFKALDSSVMHIKKHVFRAA